MGKPIKEQFVTKATKDIVADIEFRGNEIWYRTEEMTEFEPLVPIIPYFNNSFVKINFKHEVKSEELPTDKVEGVGEEDYSDDEE